MKRTYEFGPDNGMWIARKLSIVIQFLDLTFEVETHPTQEMRKTIQPKSDFEFLKNAESQPELPFQIVFCNVKVRNTSKNKLHTDSRKLQESVSMQEKLF